MGILGFFFFHWTIIIIIPGFLFALWASARTKWAFSRMKRVAASSGLSGAQAARRVLDGAGLADVNVQLTAGRLSDHYDPRTRTLALSEEVYHGNSLASVGVAAHEAGHALQHAQGYGPLALRNAIVPLASFGSNFGMILFMIGMFITYAFGATQWAWVMDVGILLFAAVVVFQIINLPVEFNASKRAIVQLVGTGVIVEQEAPATKKVLSAAAMTYVAATAMAILMLIRLLLIRGRR